jgi:hypothetical protein
MSEPQTDTLPAPQKHPCFNAESARLAAIKSHAPGSARFLPKPPKILPVQIPPEQPQDAADAFRLERLAVARKEVVRLDKLVSNEIDPKRLRDLYAALDSASERERRLSNRSLPPTIRAGSSKQRRQSGGQASFHEAEVLSDPTPDSTTADSQSAGSSTNQP